jgi:uncharacterized protein (DUF433 family)
MTDKELQEFYEQVERDQILDFYQEHIANRNG